MEANVTEVNKPVKVPKPKKSKATVEVKPKAQEKSDQEKLYNEINTPSVAQGLIESAQNLNTRFHGNWFSVLMIIKKTNVKSALDASQLVNMLVLKGLAISQERNREMYYKIQFSKANQAIALRTQLEQLEEQIRLVKATLELVEKDL